MGRCTGVKRAVDLALAAAAKESGRGVFTLGPLIHNPQAVADLEAAGVRALSQSELDGRVEGRVVGLQWPTNGIFQAMWQVGLTGRWDFARFR